MKIPATSFRRKTRNPSGPRTRSGKRKGIALITVLSLLALTTLLVIAFLSLARIEFVSSHHYADGIRARTLSEAATSIVIDQLWSATRQAETARKVESWISQPGALRRYGQDGAFTRGYKLYSDSRMLVTREEDLVNDAPPDDWDQLPARYVDLNAPVVRPNEAGGKNAFFPIVDPRAFFDDPATKQDERVEGFSYEKKIAGGSDLAGVVTPTDNPDPGALRLPMPVEWLYALRDGTIGHLDENNRFVPPDRISKDNPIVGRIAFWADDETAKLNINTASEPTFWAPPTVYHELTKRWALSQPARGEFQRYPGHPATTALSPVLFPNARLNYLDVYADPALAQAAAQIKEQIYAVVPKINGGGSLAGTREITPVTAVDTSGLIGAAGKGIVDEFKAIDLSVTRRDRLYATLDEFMLGADRSENVFPAPHEGLRLAGLTGSVVERGKFFLTANSSAPETNIFNLPRVSMWPIHRHREKGGIVYRSQFDEIIAFCATANGAPYHIHRENADKPADDVKLAQNQKIFRYLDKLTDAPFPGYGGSFGDPARYGQKGEKQQILAEIFDYIRIVNLHDDTLAGSMRVSATTSAPPEPAEGTFGTFTNPRYSFVDKPTTSELNSLNYDWDEEDSLRAFRGHGQVAPAHFDLNGAGNADAMGFGRFYTISELALHFIACADAGSPAEYPRGGRGKSNFPPLHPNTVKAIREAIAVLEDPNTNPQSVGLPANFPSQFDHLVERDGREDALRDAVPEKVNEAMCTHWNYNLEEDTPLPGNRKRIQVALYPEFFCAAAGWTQIAGDFHLRFKNLDAIKLNGASLFPKSLYPKNQYYVPDDETDAAITVAIPVDPNLANVVGSYDGGSNRGGPTGFRGFLGGRRVPDRAPLDQTHAERTHDGRKYYGKPSPQSRPWDADAAKANRAERWPLISNIIEVDRDADLRLSADGPIIIEIHAGRAANIRNLKRNLVQDIAIRFADATFRPPDIVDVQQGSLRRNDNLTDSTTGAVNGQKQSINQHDHWKQYWWTFNHTGCAQARLEGDKVVTGTNTAGGPIFGWPKNDDGTDQLSYKFQWISGRLQGARTDASLNHAVPEGGNFFRKEDVILTMIPRHGDYRLVAARKHVAEDVFVPHRLYGTQPHAHNLIVSQNTNRSYGFDYGTGTKERLVTGADYNRGRFPDVPATNELFKGANIFGDFDNGISNLYDGPYINKSDDGNTYVKYEGIVPYLDQHNVAERAGPTFFSPNRLVASPGVLGSLSTGVKRDIPWLTLLFRPPTLLLTGARHPGAESPPDHLFLDLFWMPVVEPYAISEPFSTAGKINLNYQMLPFRHIRRATGLYGVMKGEIMPAIRKSGAQRYLVSSLAGDLKDGNSRTGYLDKGKWKPVPLPKDEDWFFPIHLPETLKQFDKRFAEGGAFRSASEICELHLFPDTANGGGPQPTVDKPDSMRDFWNRHALTGDNSRELPYANIYPRLTTKSNTFRVHMRAQAIRKSSFSDPVAFDPARDKVASEYRGSTVVERHIDPADRRIPDYVASAEPLDEPGLDQFYRVRIVHSKRFDP